VVLVVLRCGLALSGETACCRRFCMPLTMAQLDDIRAECLADDIDIPAEAVSWIECEARTFFESGGTCFPRKQGLEGAETLAWYDLQQRQFESTDTNTMLDALSNALFKVFLPHRARPIPHLPPKLPANHLKPSQAILRSISFHYPSVPL